MSPSPKIILLKKLARNLTTSIYVESEQYLKKIVNKPFAIINFSKPVIAITFTVFIHRITYHIV